MKHIVAICLLVLLSGCAPKWHFILILDKPMQFGPFDTEEKCEEVKGSLHFWYKDQYDHYIPCWKVKP